MNIAYVLADNTETRAAVEQLRAAVLAVNAAYPTDVSGPHGDWLHVTTRDEAPGHNRQRGEAVRLVDMLIRPGCPLAAVQAIWPWAQYLHSLSGLPNVARPPARRTGNYQPYAMPAPIGGQRPVAQTVKPAPADAIQWDDPVCWYMAAVPTPISDMDTPWLWSTLNWCIQQAVPCWTAAGSPGGKHCAPALAAPRWLCEQPAFRALAQESVRRGMTFTDETFRFLQRFLAGVTAETAPWQDPQKAAQSGQLASILKLPTVLNSNRARRRIEVYATSHALGADEP